MIAYKLTFLHIVLTLLLKVSYGQDLQTKLQLDTIINTQIQLSNEYEKYGACIFKGTLWFNVPIWDDDSLKFVRLDLQTYRMDTIYGIVPSLVYKIKNPTAQCIDINNEYCAVKFFDSMVIFNIKDGKLEYNNIFPTVERYSYIKLNDTLLFCAQAYNHTPSDQVNKISLIVYNLKSNKVIYDLNPAINNIEFSHFNSNGSHWIDATKSRILVSQTTDYNIDIYDYKLKKIENLNRLPDKWRKFDDNIMIRLRKKISPYNPKQLIDSLTPHDEYYSRIEAAFFINDTTIYVRYIPVKQKQENRLSDFWVYRNGYWLLKEKDLVDERPADKLKMNKSNCYIMSTYYRSYFNSDFLITMKAGTTADPIGKAFKEFLKDEDEYFSDHPKPLLKIYCYKFIK